MKDVASKAEGYAAIIKKTFQPNPGDFSGRRVNQGKFPSREERRAKARSARRKGMKPLTTQQQSGMTRCRPTRNFHLPTLLQDASHRRDRLKGGKLLFFANIVLERPYCHFRGTKRSSPRKRVGQAEHRRLASITFAC